MHITTKVTAFNALIAEHKGFIRLKVKYSGYFIRYFITGEVNHCLKKLIIVIIVEYIINPH